MSTEGLLLYEFPCNEKIRFLLRFESLSRRFRWFCEQESPIAHQAAIGAIFDLSDVAARSDLRNDLVQELSRQRRSLEMSAARTHDDSESVRTLLAAFSEASAEVSHIVGRSGQNVRDNEWLQLIRNRQQLPGGTCEFDMPQLHYWLSRPAAERRAELESLTETLRPIMRAVELILGQMRTTSQTRDATAVNGMLQLPVTGKNYTLARIWLPGSLSLVPEVSANKYMLWIRFSRPDERSRLHVVQENIPFRLGLCL